VSTRLQRALEDPGDPPVAPLPPACADLLVELAAPPRLAAHLRLVHDVAAQLSAWLAGQHPAVAFDRDAVLFGAATHDIGKVRHIEELSGPGSLHERAGQQLLLDAGVDPSLARFAATHGDWDAPGIQVEDLLVSVADKTWKAKRVPELEQLLIDRLVQASGHEPWQVFLDLDDHLGQLAAGADQRLAFQNSHPITS